MSSNCSQLYMFTKVVPLENNHRRLYLKMQYQLNGFCSSTCIFISIIQLIGAEKENYICIHIKMSQTYLAEYINQYSNLRQKF